MKFLHKYNLKVSDVFLTLNSNTGDIRSIHAFHTHNVISSVHVVCLTGNTAGEVAEKVEPRLSNVI